MPLDDEHHAEAKRLAKLPREDQRAVIALHRSVADNPKVPKRDRDLARERAETLERLLQRLRRARTRRKPSTRPEAPARNKPIRANPKK
jgi:hypothetical protein